MKTYVLLKDGSKWRAWNTVTKKWHGKSNANPVVVQKEIDKLNNK